MSRDAKKVTTAYIECMIWADCPEEDINRERVTSPELDKQARDDVEDFLALLDREKVDSTDWSDEQLGHDFWLTRQGHGAGFWDRGLPAGETLTKWAKTYGSKYLYVGDDGLFYLS